MKRIVFVFLIFFFTGHLCAQLGIQFEKNSKRKKHKYIEQNEKVVYKLSGSDETFLGTVTHINDSLIFINQKPVRPADIKMIGIRKKGRNDFLKSGIAFGVTSIIVVQTIQRSGAVLFVSMNALSGLGTVAAVGYGISSFYFYKGIWDSANPRIYYSHDWKIGIGPVSKKGLKHFFKGII